MNIVRFPDSLVNSIYLAVRKIDQEVSKGLIVHFLCIIIYPADAKAGKAERLPSPCYELIRSKKHRCAGLYLQPLYGRTDG